MQKDCNMGLTDGFCRACSCTGLPVLSTDIYYPDFRDSLANSGTFFTGNHKGTTESSSQTNIKTPPQLPVKSLISHTHKPLDQQQYAVCLSCHHKDFDKAGFKSTDCCSGMSRTQLYLEKCHYNRGELINVLPIDN